MSADPIKAVTLTCDMCHRTRRTDDTTYRINTARKRAAQFGWRQHVDGRDMCPDCAQWAQATKEKS